MSQETIERTRNTAQGDDGGTVVTDDGPKTGKGAPPGASRSGGEGGTLGESGSKTGKAAPPASRSGEEGGTVGESETKAGKAAP